MDTQRERGYGSGGGFWNSTPTPRQGSDNHGFSRVLATQQAAEMESSPFDHVVDQVRERIRGANLLNAAQFDDPSPEDLEMVRRLALEVIKAYNDTAAGQSLPRLDGEPDALAGRVVDEILGWGPLAAYMNDDQVEEVIINGPDDIRVIYAGGRKEQAGDRFRSAEALRNFLNRKIESGRGQTLNAKNPHQDARLPDGSRLFVAMPPIVANIEAPVATIRRFRPVARDMDSLIRLGTVTPQLAVFLQAAINAKLNIAIAGGTGTGKTTFINALCAEMPPQDRLVTVEDTPELQPPLEDWVALVTRKESEGVAPITMRDLVRDCLRMRPDRIILGEARGGEMLEILIAMNTGHDGVMFTVHANSVRDTFARIENMYLMGQSLPMLVVRRQIVSALDLIVHLTRRKGQRFISGIGEVYRIEGDLPVIEEIFAHDGTQGAPIFTGTYPSAGLMARLGEGTPGFDFRRDVVGMRN